MTEAPAAILALTLARAHLLCPKAPWPLLNALVRGCGKTGASWAVVAAAVRDAAGTGLLPLAHADRSVQARALEKAMQALGKPELVGTPPLLAEEPPYRRVRKAGTDSRIRFAHLLLRGKLLPACHTPAGAKGWTEAPAELPLCPACQRRWEKIQAKEQGNGSLR